MTNENGKPTLEEIAVDTLGHERYQKVFAVNHVLENQDYYGTKGKAIAQAVYDGVMSSDEIQERRQTAYDRKKAEFRENNVHGLPSYLSDSDISNEIIKEMRQSMEFLTLSKLEEIVQNVTKIVEYEVPEGKKGIIRKITKGFEYEVPEELKGYSIMKIEQKLMAAARENDGRVDISEVLTEDELRARESYQMLVEAYIEGIVKPVLDSDKNYYAALNAKAQELTRRYAPAPVEAEVEE